MALIRARMFSKCLRRPVRFTAVVPYDGMFLPPRGGKPFKTMYLLHGYMGNNSTLQLEGWPVGEWAQRFDIAVIMPEGENHFYVDDLARRDFYGEFIGRELVAMTRRLFPLSDRREDTVIAGLSMGGFGALHTGLAYPDRFGKIGALSSALIVHEVAGMKPGQGNAVANYDYYRECFGDPATAAERDCNPEVLARKLKAEGKTIPGIYMACGTEDFLIENNREFHRFLVNEEIPHEYHEGKGIHDMVFWTEHIRNAVEWMFNS